MVFVGNLPETVEYKDLLEAFIPFGEIKKIDIPADPISGKTRGFAFVEYDEPEDAQHAIFNKHNSLLQDVVISVDKARGHRTKDMLNRPIWADEDYYANTVQQDDEAPPQDPE